MSHGRRSYRGLLLAVALLPPAPPAGRSQVVSTVPAQNRFAPRHHHASPSTTLLTSSTSASFVFGRQTGLVPVDRVLNADRTLTITPHPFAAGEIVVVNLSHDVRSVTSTPLRSAGFAFQFQVSAAAASRNFQKIDVMSNRIGGAQTRIYGAVQADFDHDGWIDLATVNEVSADLRVFMNRADGSGLYDPFLRPPFPVGVESSPNEPGDFDNDGKIDIAVSATERRRGSRRRGRRHVRWLAVGAHRQRAARRRGARRGRRRRSGHRERRLR